jgi:hypothetical protein
VTKNIDTCIPTPTEAVDVAARVKEINIASDEFFDGYAKPVTHHAHPLRNEAIGHRRGGGRRTPKASGRWRRLEKKTKRDTAWQQHIMRMFFPMDPLLYWMGFKNILCTVHNRRA